MRSLILALAAVLSGCGGGGCMSPSIQIEGDSISLGVGGDPASSPGALLSAAFPGVPVTATGHSSSTTADRINGTNGYSPFPQGVVGTVYITEFGVAAAARGEDLAAFRANIRRIASTPGAVLETPTPAVGFDTAPYVQVVREVAAELHVPVAEVNAYVLSVPNWQSMTVDGVHPGSELYRMIYTNVVIPTIAPLVRCE